MFEQLKTNFWGVVYAHGSVRVEQRKVASSSTVESSPNRGLEIFNAAVGEIDPVEQTSQSFKCTSMHKCSPVDSVHTGTRFTRLKDDFD